jgi:trans-aconitate methyltransferase
MSDRNSLVVPNSPAALETVGMYDRIPETFARHFAGDRSHVPDIKLAHQLAGVALGESQVVEIGCGDGRDAETAFVPNSGTYNGYDPSEGLLTLAKARFPDRSEDMFRQGYAQTTDYPLDRDIMFAVNSILHVPKYDLGDMYDRIAEGLRRGGVFYAITKVEDKDRTEVYHDDFDGVKGERTFYHHSPQTLAKMAIHSGLRLAYSQRTAVENKSWDWYTFAVDKTA